MIAALKEAAARLLQGSGLLALRERSRRGKTGIVLMYHRVNDADDPFFPALDTASFAAQLDLVRATYQVETMEGLLGWLADGRPGPPRVAITIDDGYLDTHEQALPRLKARGLPATLFLATGPPETGQPLWLDRLCALLKHTTAETLALPSHDVGPWPLGTTAERLSALGRLAGRLKRSGKAELDAVVAGLWQALGGEGVPLPPGLSWDHVRELAAGGVAIGAHTHHHYILSRIRRAEALQDVGESLDLIARRVGTPARGFAYPNGTAADYSQETIDVLRELGVSWACTTRPGFVKAGAPRLELPRIYTSMDSLASFACRLARLTRLSADDAGALAN